MAARNKPGKAGKPPKGGRGKMPVKRSINLVLVDENKISVVKAIPAVLLIVLLAALFSKFLVADRLVAMSQAANRASQLRTQLDDTIAEVRTFGEVEDTYAHYTYAGMTDAEQSLVARTDVLALVNSVLPVSDTDLADSSLSLEALYDSVVYNLGDLSAVEDTLRSVRAWRARARLFLNVDKPVEVSARAWSVTGNVLTVEVNGVSLERLNQLGRKMEEYGIVDSCTLTAANKKSGKQQGVEDVTGRFIVYLRQPPEEVSAQ